MTKVCQLLFCLALSIASFTLMGCGSEEGDSAGDNGGDNTVSVNCATNQDGDPRDEEGLCCQANAQYMKWNSDISMWLGCCNWDPDSNNPVQCSGGVGCVNYDAATFAQTSTHDYSQDCYSDSLVCQKKTADDVCYVAWDAARAALINGASDTATVCTEIQKYGQCLKDAQCCVSGTDGDPQIQRFNEALLSQGGPCTGSNSITNPCSNVPICAADAAANCASAYATATATSSDAAILCPEFEKYSQCLKDAGCCGVSVGGVSYVLALDAIFTGTTGSLCSGINAVTNPCNPDLKVPCSVSAATDCASAWATTAGNAPTDPAAAAAALCPELEKYTQCLKDAACCDDSVAGQAQKQALQTVIDNVGNSYCTGSNAITNQCT